MNDSFENTLVALIKLLEIQKDSLEREAFWIYLQEGFSEKWKRKVKQATDIEMLLERAVDGFAEVSGLDLE